MQNDFASRGNLKSKWVQNTMFLNSELDLNYIEKITINTGIFLVPGGFAKWPISSYLRVQITQESVRLIALIGLNMFCIHIAYMKSLKKISDARFSLSVLKKCLKMAFFGVFKAFISNFLYYNLY